MSMLPSKVQARLLARFADRDELTADAAWTQYWSDLPKESVLSALTLLHTEYGIPPGLLRPDDNLSRIFDTVPAGNPFSQIANQARAEDAQSEVNYELGKRMKRFGTLGTWKRIRTVGDLVRAWCGERPRPIGQ